MSVACPECGGDVPVAARTIPVLAGACPSCSREVLLLSPGTQPMAAAAPPAEAPEPALSIPHPGDDDCDGTLELKVVGGDRLVGVCSDCEEEFTFRLFTAREEEDDDSESRPPARERAPRRPFNRRSDDGAPPSRPCRQCGGALSFETAEDGTVTGHCASCGNTFSLAPRRDGGRGGGGGGRFGGRGGGGRGYGGGGGYRGRPSGGRFERRDRDGDSDDRRRRRFRRDD